MKKIIYLTIPIIVISLGIIEWHCYERKAWAEWKVNSLTIVDLVQEAEVAGMTNEELENYYNKLKDSLNISTPVPCPYCRFTALIK